ncbi:MAG: membrane protein insertase YidC [Sphaerochaetaceae bacterium]|nr:membrane protein insertase YidC [Sphaerochaetaceae bacterium]
MNLFYALLIGPIEFIIEFVFAIIYRFSENPGISIIGVSLIVQLLVLPLYKRSDAIQEEERNKQKSMEKWVNQIKRCYHGDKRVMVLSAYYREQNYKPIYALRGAISLLLQIPFFMAAYNYLSKLKLLEGVSFFCFSNLAKPDALISFAGVTINVLPVVMTLVNIVSGAIYTRGFKLKEKLQLYIMALVFLVLLYNSPSGLVLYWTMNNVFSLGKNLVGNLSKKYKRFGYYLCALAGVVILMVAIKMGYASNFKKMMFFVAICVAGSIPLLCSFLNTEKQYAQEDEQGTYKHIFYVSCILLTLLMGLLIPSSVIKSSPAEFSPAPMSISRVLMTTLCMFGGLFLVWVNIYYVLMQGKFKKMLSCVMLAFFVVGLVNFLFFGKDLGILSYNLIYDKEVIFTSKQMLFNVVVDIAVISVVCLIFFRFRKFTQSLTVIFLITVISICLVNIVTIGVRLKTVHVTKTDKISAEKKLFAMSRTGKNVIVIMLDRAPGYLFPFELTLYPQLKNLYDGFTFYPNTVSFGGWTTTGSPALFGGYEYTPDAINNRPEESLHVRHNEALKVLPAVFSDEGYDVTVINPPTEEYVRFSDLSIYDGYENVKAYDLNGVFRFAYEQKYSVSDVRSFLHNYFWFPIMKCCPLFLYDPFYDTGSYVTTSSDVIDAHFANEYSTLLSLTDIVEIEDGQDNTFLMLQNTTPHSGTISEVTAPISTVKDKVPFVTADTVVSAMGGGILDTSNYITVYHIRCQLAALITLGEWFDYLRECGVYDNTRIILTSDHGFDLGDGIVKGAGGCFNPIMLVKDFNSHGFTVSNEFMTNADSPTLAVNGLFNAVNPFTGKEINNKNKFVMPQPIFVNGHQSATKFGVGNGEWWTVKDNIFDPTKWVKIK